MKTNWKEVCDYEGLYWINKKGEVKNKHLKKLKLRKDKNGYLIAYLYKNKIMKCKKVHRLVAQSFIPNPDNLPQVNHKDGNKQNNCDKNLEWCTVSQNIKHAWQTGLKTKKFGKNHNNAVEILQYDKNKKLIKKWFSIVDASKYYKTTISNIWHCLNGYNKTAKGYIWKYKK